MTRAEKLKAEITSQRSRGEIVDKVHILANGQGYSYESLFGKYLDDKVTEVSLEEPYLREYYQVGLFNFLMFIGRIIVFAFS